MNARAQRWHRVSELFDRVVDLGAEERERILSDECADDPQLRTEVERLLAADERTNPVDRDIAGQASQLLLEGDPHEHEGERFGPYRIVKLLGQGGMGRVYLAEREGEDFAQTVALKLVGGYGNFDAALARRRFLDERRILARLQHPHIARLLDGGVGPEAQPWFAMEYVDGAPLTEWCDARKLSVHERLTLFAKVCDAVDHAHRFLIVHRDIKPGNILVDAQGEPKVLDFGIAKLLDEGAQDRTGSTILMTPDYAAPEQIRGGQISTATDVYALGAVLFELLTGRKPFCDPLASREPPQASRAATEGLHTGERAQARATTPQALRKSLRGDLDRVLRTALDPEPARRYRSAALLAQDLRAVAEGQAISLRNDTGYRMKVFLRRHKWETAVATVAVLGLLGTTGWALWQTRIATRNASEAARQAEEAARYADVANQESKTANSVKNVIASMLNSASPEVSLGQSLTVKQVLDESRRTLPISFEQEPLVAVELLTVMARSYMALEDYGSARQLLDSALGHASALDSARKAMLHTARLELAIAVQDEKMGRLASGALRSALLLVTAPDLRVDALMALAIFESVTGNQEFKQTLSALADTRERLPRSDPRRLSAAAVLADLRINNSLGRGDQSETTKLITYALADADRHLPPMHPLAASLRKKLAVLYILQDEPMQAIPLLERALDDDLAVYGSDSIVTARTFRYLAQAEQLAGNYDLLLTHSQSALKIFQSKANAEKTDLATTQEYLADVAAVRGQFARARVGYQAAYEAHLSDETHMGMELFTRLKIARMLLLEGDRASATRLYGQIAAQARPGSAAQAVAWIGQGDLARMAGDPESAADLHRRAADQLKMRIMAPGAPIYRLWALQQLATDLQAMNREQESQEVLGEVLTALEKKFPYHHPYLTEAYLMQGRMLAATGKNPVEAQRLLQRCVALRERVYGASHPHTREAKTALEALG